MDPIDLPVLYSFRRCPYAMRARLALAVSGQVCELREILLRDKAPEFLDTSPSATVPALQYGDGEVIDESLDIMLWALSRNDPENWLKPETGSLDEMLALIELADGDFKASLDRYKYPTRYYGVDGLMERTNAVVFLNDLNRRLAASPFLSGKRCALADMAIAPFVRQFANVDRPWFGQEPWPHLLRWLETFLASDLFAGIMAKYPKWAAGDPITKFPALAEQSQPLSVAQG